MRIARRTTIALGFIAIALVTGCQPELRVKLATQTERIPDPAIIISDPAAPGERPKYDTIQLITEDRRVVWHLRANPFGTTNSVAQFRYGQSLSGFDTVIAPAPLEAGKSYSLTVSGVGVGTLHLAVDADGNVSPVR